MVDLFDSVAVAEIESLLAQGYSVSEVAWGLNLTVQVVTLVKQGL